MSIIAWIVLGLIAGAIGKFLMPGRDPGGIIVSVAMGQAAIAATAIHNSLPPLRAC